MKIRPYSRIVVEGMDGSGKTTLVNHLLEYLGDRGQAVPGYNRVIGRKSPIDQWWMEQLGINPMDKVVVHDRFFYPEFVYGPILRGKIKGSKSSHNYVANFLRSNAFLIYCRPPNKMIVEGVEVEAQMEGIKPKFWQLLVAYDKLMIEEAPKFNGKFMKYDWTDETHYSRLLKTLTGYIY